MKGKAMKQRMPSPRNPLVRLARFRRAGAHQSGRKSARQAAQRQTRNALCELKFDGP
jgi:hypothetical protein